MKKSKKIAIILALVLIISLTAGCGGSTNDTPGSGTTTTSSDSAPVDKVYKIKFGGNMGVDSPISIYQQEIADYVNEKSGGRIEMTSYPASQLGDSTLMLEDMMNGTIQMCVFYTPNIYDDRYAINSFPYLVTNSEEFARICDKDSAFFKTYSAIHEEHNIKLLGIHADGLIGMNFTKYPENYNDVNARKSTVMRTPLVDAYKISMEKMGYPTTSVAWADLYSALQTGVCDGAVGATAITCYDNFRDVTKYWCAYNCFAEIADYMINLEFWNELPDDLKQIIQEAIDMHVEKQLGEMDRLNAEYTQKLEANGTEILPITQEELDAYANKVRTEVWPQLAEIVGQDMVDAITADFE